MFTNKMICQIDEYMLYCQSKQLSEKTDGVEMKC